MRLLHTMLRVGDLERSLAFYTEVLKMSLLRRKDYPSGRFTLAFVGYGPESDQTVLELTHNWDTQAYDVGDGYGHIARVWRTSLAPVPPLRTGAVGSCASPAR